MRRFGLLLLVLASLFLGSIVGETGLRLAGRRPASMLRPANEPVLLEPDPVRGWRNKPGHYVYPSYRDGASVITVTVGPEHQRATAPTPLTHGDAVWLFGCSFTFGWAVSDHETFAWQLQERAPAWSVTNYGTAAYGTYQALLLLRAKLREPSPPPAIAVYGFLPDHAMRNVAAYDWLRALQTGRQALPIPYVEWRNAQLVEHSPERAPRLPFRSWLATSAAAEDLLLRRWARDRADHAQAATVRLVSEMNAAVQARGARFVLALLAGPGAALDAYARDFGTAGIEVADCRQHLGWDRRVVGEGHPNGMAHAAWAHCLADAITAH